MNHWLCCLPIAVLAVSVEATAADEIRERIAEVKPIVLKTQGASLSYNPPRESEGKRRGKKRNELDRVKTVRARLLLKKALRYRGTELPAGKYTVQFERDGRKGWFLVVSRAEKSGAKSGGRKKSTTANGLRIPLREEQRKRVVNPWRLDLRAVAKGKKLLFGARAGRSVLTCRVGWARP